MNLRLLTVALVATTAYSGVAAAFDSIYVKGASRHKSGRIVTISPQKVTLEGRGNVRSDIEVRDIEMIFFDEDPQPLKDAKRLARRNASYSEALEMLNKIKAKSIIRRESGQDLEFYKALCKSRLAIAGRGDVTEAGREMLAFVKKNKNSYHYYEAYEVIGDTLVSGDKASAAIKYGYDKLKTAPWPSYKTRANLAIANAYLSSNNPKQALSLFDQVLSAGTEGQKLSATLGKARCLAADKAGAAQGAKLIEAVIAKADEKDNLLHARAYNAMGYCLEKAGDYKSAVLAYLHVDVLYFMYPAEHAEALHQLSRLWSQLSKLDRSARAGNELKKRYPGSRWNR